MALHTLWLAAYFLHIAAWWLNHCAGIVAVIQ
jgi:hypothetical protein